MARKIIKKIGGDRLGSGKKMSVAAHGYGYSTHDVSKIRRTSMSFGTLVPMGQWLMTSGSRLRMKLDALITSNALNYQLYGSAKFQLDVFEARLALYNPKMLLNLNDQGYQISDIKFPQMMLKTNGVDINDLEKATIKQINPSSLLRYLGIAANGTNSTNFVSEDVTRSHNAMWLLMYYQIVKEYYANKQEKKGYIIHQASTNIESVIKSFDGDDTNVTEALTNGINEAGVTVTDDGTLQITTNGQHGWENVILKYNVGLPGATGMITLSVEDIINNLSNYLVAVTTNEYTTIISLRTEFIVLNWRTIYYEVKDLTVNKPQLVEYDLKAIDRMQMQIMANVESTNPIIINSETELPYGASFKTTNSKKSINSTQEGIALGTYQSDVFNNWLDNDTINTLNSKNKIKVNSEGEFSIDMLNITQKLYNYDMRIGVTDGTLDEWREMTYGKASKNKSLKPVYCGGLTKEILFDMVISTAATDDEPLGSIASRGQFGGKHKGGYVQIEADEEKMVMVIAKITPRLVYNQGNDWTTNLKTLDDLHKPALDKIGYQNLITDTMVAIETRVSDLGVLTTYSAGKQPAYQWYRTNYDDALGNMADVEDYKVFGRQYEVEVTGGGDAPRIKDLTTYIDPTKFNDVFAIKSLDAMNFDVQVGMDTTITLVMSEEVIPNL